MIIFAAMLLFVVPSCHRTKREAKELDASAEMPIMNEVEEQDNGKSYFVNERYVYWESGDEITLSVNNGAYDDISEWDEWKVCNLTYGADSRNGKFRVRVPEGEDEASFAQSLALFPATSEVNSDGDEVSNRVTWNSSSFDVECHLADKQYYRPDFSRPDLVTGSDLTFSRKALPMVAYTASGPLKMRFYTPCGLIRLQLYSSSTAKDMENGEKGFVNLDKIILTCTGVNGGAAANICGDYSITDYTTQFPTMTNTAGSTTITYDCGEDGVLIDNDIKSFYIVLPYIYAADDDNRTLYNMQIQFVNKSGGTLTGNLSVRVARNTITKVPAIDVKTKNKGIVGNGTELRPFQIYDFEDLKLVRDAFNLATPVLNGVPLSSPEDTIYFRLSRNDIVLTTDNWTSEGIKLGQKCVFVGAENTITNNSNYAVFHSNEGFIRHLFMEGTAQTTPFCKTNSGRIDHCHVNVYDNATGHFAGFCETNSGTINRCDYGIKLATSTVSGVYNFAGICLTNTGTIENTFCDCNLSGTGATISGICHENAGTITNCWITKGIAATNAYGICAINSDTITRCSTREHEPIVGKSAGAGICGTNTGTIDMCYNLSEVQSNNDVTGNGHVGGLVYQNNGGVLRNSYNKGAVYSATGNAAGLVYDNGTGELKNCYNTGNVTGNYSFVAAIAGNNTAGNVANCYTTGDITDPSPHNTKYTVKHGTGGSSSNIFYKSGEVFQGTPGASMSDNDMKAAAFVTTLNTWVSGAGSSYKEWQTVADDYPTLIY